VSYQTLADIPDTFIVGDTVKWTTEITGYPPATWTGVYYFVKDGDQVIITATESNGVHLFTVDASSGFEAGVYNWILSVDDGADRHTLRRGRITAQADYEDATTGYDDRSHVKKTLDALEAVIEGRASNDQSSYSIAGRSLSRMDIADLLMWRDKYKSYYAQEVKAERIRRGLGHAGKIKVRFK